MNLVLPLDDQFNETNYSREPLTEASRSCCKVINGNSCGSGSIVGERNGRHLVLTNAHVAGSRVGRTVQCTFPFLNNARVDAKVILAAYSDRIMMDWAILELPKVDLKAYKLSIETPTGNHVTMGYPRCRGPYSQTLTTRQITHRGTVWRWQPNSIGGQSGSGVHSPSDNLQYGLLTWSWGGDGAGQTTRSIWFQYANRAAVGFERPEGLLELNHDNRAADLENGFFAETNITKLDIWDHLDEDTDPTPEPGPGNEALAKEVSKQAEKLQKQAAELAELARKYGGTGTVTPPPEEDDTGPLFGL